MVALSNFLNPFSGLSHSLIPRPCNETTPVAWGKFLRVENFWGKFQRKISEENWAAPSHKKMGLLPVQRNPLILSRASQISHVTNVRTNLPKKSSLRQIKGSALECLTPSRIWADVWSMFWTLSFQWLSNFQNCQDKVFSRVHCGKQPDQKDNPGQKRSGIVRFFLPGQSSLWDWAVVTNSGGGGRLTWSDDWSVDS